MLGEESGAEGVGKMYGRGSRRGKQGKVDREGFQRGQERALFGCHADWGCDGLIGQKGEAEGRARAEGATGVSRLLTCCSPDLDGCREGLPNDDGSLAVMWAKGEQGEGTGVQRAIGDKPGPN